MREIDILHTPPVHAGDAQGLKEEILASLGFPTAEYREAFDKLASASSSSSPRARLPSLSDELSMVVVDAEQEEDEQMAWALTDSVQLIARSHGVAAHYRVGHADGKGPQLLDPVGLRSRRRQPRPRAGGGIPPGART